ncbi:MAG: CD3324 family protein [Bacteroidales bacterium]|nr:CD3324 family protein [Bacteroidales bacterium]MCM1414356.1 CD3324 family protein [bacterium]MCM1422238.1 CD3324 family protein [bacterium]
MSYKRADDILPEDILEILQTYVSGEAIYVPGKKEYRKRWGSSTGANETLRIRNEQILEQYRKGVPVKELALRYYLTEKSIQRIIREMQEKPPTEQKKR